MRSKAWPLIVVVFLSILTGGCWASPTQQTFDGQRAYQHVIAQCDLGPRPTGSAAGWATGDYIIAELKELGWAVTSQEFTYKEIKGRNIAGRRGRGPVVILGAHYDTRPYADYDPVDKNQPILGANDGASGVAVLLELARSLD
ncbi:MAG: M28 family peptidase, partial [Anaerolineae bacterium]